MSYRVINIGSGEGAGDGDSIRLAFEKSNSNFEVADNRLQVLETGVVRADGTVTGNIVPDTDVTYDLGSSSKKFKDLYLSGNTITLGNQTISSSASGINTSGNFTTTGTIQATTITSTAPSNLSGSFTGDLKGSVYSDGSATMIDGVAGLILGDVRNTYVETGNIILSGNTIGSSSGDLNVAPTGSVNITTGLSVQGHADLFTANFGPPGLEYATIDSISLKVNKIDGPISGLPGAVLGISSGTGIELRSAGMIDIEGDGGILLTGGEVTPGAGPSDVVITGGPISMNGNAVIINSDDVTFNNGSGTVDFGSTTVDFSSATVNGLNPGVDLTAFSVGAESSASGDGGIAYDNSTGVFTYTPPDLSGYQATLVSGTNIKTLNYGSLLGSGNIDIEAYSDDKVNLLLGTDPTLGGVTTGYILSYDNSEPIQKYQWIPQSSGGADLSAVNQNYTPDTDNAYDLGIAAGNFLRSGYFKTSVVIGTGQYSSATLTYNADGQLQSSAGINTSALYSSSYMSLEPKYGGLIFWMDGDPGGGTLGYSANNGSNEMTWSGDMYSNGPTYQLDSDQANLQIGAEVTKTISGITLGATTSLNFSDPYYFNPGSTVTITGVIGTTELNNQTYYIDNSNNLYSDPSLSTPINSSTFTAYVSGGTAVVAPRATASLPVLHSAPANPKSGMMAVADGTNWNPTSTGTETMVVYLGGGWRTIANA